MSPICIVDYGVGNIHSAMKALRKFHADVVLTADPKILASASALVLPGVGAFAAGMEGLRERKLVETIRTFGATGKPMLGICLGAQLLLSKGYEYGECEGLGLIEGTVEHFPPLHEEWKVPNIGWSHISPPKGKSWDGTILQNLPKDPMAYFVHSFIMKPKLTDQVLAQTEYGGCAFASVIRRGNVFGCQFHPEKSAHAGLKIIGNFVKISLQ